MCLRLCEDACIIHNEALQGVHDYLGSIGNVQRRVQDLRQLALECVKCGEGCILLLVSIIFSLTGVSSRRLPSRPRRVALGDAPALNDMFTVRASWVYWKV